MRADRAAAALLLAGSLAACSSAATTTATTTAAASAAPAAATASPSPAAPRVVGPTPPGALADLEVPAAQRTVEADVAFGALPVGDAGGGDRKVLYPWVHLTAGADGTLVAHLKLPVFTCRPSTLPTLAVAASTCRDRRVQYADADAGSAVLTVDGRQHVRLDVAAVAYGYDSGVDRAPGLAPHDEGAPVRLVVDLDPGAVLPAGGDARWRAWRPVARVTAPDVPGAPSASSDDGYDNRLRLVRP